MRIAIDLQSAQLHGNEHGSDQQALALTLALLRSPGQHSVRILLNGALPRVAELRALFAGLLAQEHIRVFDSIAPAHARNVANAGRRRASELVREYTITQLQADAVLAWGLFDGFDDDSVLSISRFEQGPQTVLLLDHAAAQGDEPAFQAFLDKRLGLLGQADLVLTLSDAAHAQSSALLDPARTLRLAPALDAAAAAAAILAALESDLGRALAKPKPPRTRRRLAFVTPLPPERTGIADYAAQLLPAMLDDFDITLIVQQQEVTLPPVLANLPRHDATWLSAHAHEFDQLLYQFGNSPFHSSMFDLLRAHPGVVVLHDFFLSNVLAYEQMTGGIPNAWSDALFYSHGFAALQASQLPDNHAAAMNDFPCNREVLEGATRIIVHSDHARQLAQEWYGAEAARNWTVVPLPRSAPPLRDRQGARAALGIDDDTFLVCTFGYIGPSKLSDVLVDAWLASSLHRDARCMLVLVGANHTGEFGARLTDTIQDAGASGSIRIAGWTDDAVYHHYLQAADMGVQLRSISRGETSAAVLDVMNYGLPAIVNANGSMAALPSDAVWMLPDQVELPELVSALETLYRDPERRDELGARARDVLRSQHRPDHCAARYRDALDLAMVEAETSRHVLLRTLGGMPLLRDDDAALRALASTLARAPDPLAQRQLLVDVSAIAQHDLKTGIERVVRTQLLELLVLRQSGVRVEPVYLSTQGNRWHYRYARRYATRLMGIQAPGLPDAPIDFQPGDIFYSADYSAVAVSEAARAGVYAGMRAQGVSINFLIHDLLPVLRPEFFPSNAEQVHASWLRCIAANADRLLCISDAVAHETESWLGQQDTLPPQRLKLAVLHHGADIDHPASSTGDAAAAVAMATTLAARPSFLMVGTIEPRKGHLQTLAAFEQLWAAGEQINLVIVGNEGWKGLPTAERRTIPTIVERLSNHPEAGQRLLWLQGVNDQLLETIYRNSTCLLQPSEGEGFGLPLIEAARYGVPILARGLPVFREVAQEHALYFDGLDPADLAAAVRHWLALRDAGGVPASGGMHCQTWRQNAEQLLRILHGEAEERDWRTPAALPVATMPQGEAA
jgi:glycosyltransferase involved in cell wall biosynthesis